MIEKYEICQIVFIQHSVVGDDDKIVQKVSFAHRESVENGQTNRTKKLVALKDIDQKKEKSYIIWPL